MSALEYSRRALVAARTLLRESQHLEPHSAASRRLVEQTVAALELTLALLATTTAEQNRHRDGLRRGAQAQLRRARAA